MTTQPKCPTCGSEISGEGEDGLCLKCLGRLGFTAERDGPQDGALPRLGDYELLEEIARGGMGVVYRARQVSLNRIVALKVVLNGPFSSADFVRRFRQEAQAVAALRHPNIVAIHEVGEQNGSHFLSLDYVEGQNFAQLAKGSLLPARRAAGYLKIIAEAVEHAHQRGVLHRDLKPSNILLDIFDQPRVTDFGLAKLAGDDGELTVSGQVLGSPHYMPPEQAAGKHSGNGPASDVYSLGAILYELLTGRPPFQGETLSSILAQAQTADPVPPRRLNPGTPPDLQTICLKCLQKEPARRYATARALAQDLACFLENKPIQARPVHWLERAWLWCRRHPAPAAMAAALAAAVILGVAGVVWQWRQAEFHARGESQLRLAAEREAAQSRLNLYAADVAVASQAIQNGNFGRARRTLEALRAKPGETDLRGFEWRYLWNLCRGAQLATLTGHHGTVTCAAFSPDGKRLATGSHDGTVRIWDVAQHTCAATLEVSPQAVWSVTFMPEGKDLMTASMKSVELWDIGAGAVRAHFPGELAALSKTGDFLASSDANPFFWEPAGAVTLWNWRTGVKLRDFDRPGRALALSPDGSLLAVAGTNNVITVWNTSTGAAVRECPAREPVWSLNFSPDGGSILATGWSINASLWKLDQPAPRVLSGHSLHVWAADFSPDGSTLATASSDQTARLWDAATLQEKAVFRGHDSEVWCVAFSPDGKLLATGGKDQNVMLWSTAPSRTQIDLPHNMDARPAFSADGKWLVTCDPASGHSMLWNADDRTLVRDSVAEGRRVLGFSRDGTCVATFDTVQWSLNFWLPNGTDPQRMVTLDGASAANTQFVFTGFSPEQAYFFAIDATGLIHVWDADTGRLVRAMQGPAPPIRNAALSPQGRRMAVSIESEGVAHLYDCATGVERPLEGHRDFVSGLAFSPDGGRLATGSMDGSIRLWNTADGAFIAALPGHMQETTDVAFSSDGRTLASLGRNESIKLWHLPTMREVLSANEPHAGQWVQFSPDGRKLAFESDTNELRVLAAPTE